MKESEKKDKYRDLAREIKKLLNMKVTVISIVIGAHGTVTKGLVKELEDLEIRGRVETILTTALPEYREESWKLEETCYSNSGERPSSNAEVKKSQSVKFIIKGFSVSVLRPINLCGLSNIKFCFYIYMICKRIVCS